MKQEKLIKIALVGPESSGKTTLSAQLAAHYETLWVPEYARYYCEALEGPCSLDDERNMFYGQVALEAAMSSVARHNLLICDTTFLTVKIWSDYQLGETPAEVLKALPEYHYDLYLLLQNDLPWEDDPLRDFPGMGDYFLEVWRKELTALNARFTEIGGVESRLQNCIRVIDEFLATNSN